MSNATTTGIIGSFTPTTNGTVAVGAITEHAVANVPKPHLITTDTQGNVWYSGGLAGVIGRFSSGTSTNTVFDISLDACPVGSPPSCGVHISGAAVDSQGRVWFDELCCTCAVPLYFR